MYAGIDYSLGMANIDKNGIHYGVISQYSLMPEALSDIEPVYQECETCENNSECEQFKQGEFCDSDPIGLEYNADGYQIIDCLDSDLMILKSPFVTRAQYCSPCCPGAGNLDVPCPDGPLTYCLGSDWFDGGVAPYSYQTVKDALKAATVRTHKKNIK